MTDHRPPPEQRPESAEYTEAHIEQRLTELADELGIRAVVRPPKVYLHGSVASEQRRARLTEVVRSVVPGYEIHNEVTVTSAAEPEGREDLR